MVAPRPPEASGQAGRHLVGALCSRSGSAVLGTVLLEQRHIQKAFTTPHTLELLLTGVNALVLVEMLALLEGFIAVGALVGLLTRVHSPVTLQV